MHTSLGIVGRHCQCRQELSTQWKVLDARQAWILCRAGRKGGSFIRGASLKEKGRLPCKEGRQALVIIPSEGTESVAKQKRMHP